MDWCAVGKRIRAARERAGYTQEELAAELGMSPTHISVLERGVKPPKLETFVNIANTLAVSADTLLQDLVSCSSTGAANSLAADIMKLPKRERELISSMIKLTKTVEE